jgi:hypothetical protein
MDAISDLPPTQSIALLAPERSLNGAVLQAAIGSISWPHRICLIDVTRSNVRSTFEGLRHADYAAAFLFGFSPPTDPANRQVGALTLMRVTQ